MAHKRTVFGVANFKKSLSKRVNKLVKYSEEDVVVGFVQTYSIFVHEAHKTQKKFLEQPFRTGLPIIKSIVNKEVQRTDNLTEAMIAAGEWLKISAQSVTPVDTGSLKSSAFVTVASKEDEVAKQSFVKAEALRQAVLAGRKNAK